MHNVMGYIWSMTNELKDILCKKSNEVLQGIQIFLDKNGKEVTFEMFEKEFPHIQGKALGSLFSAITRTSINNKSIVIAIPQFGSRRKTWKLSKKLTDKERETISKTIKDILEERL